MGMQVTAGLDITDLLNILLIMLLCGVRTTL
jgi:hypothetical protein